MKIKFISFYTPRYADEARRLLASMDKHGLDYYVDAIPQEFGTGPDAFLAAVRHKPAFIFECMQKFSEYDAIVWTDADSEFLKPPKLLFELECDVAVRYRDSFELLAGTMYWRVCYKVVKFLPDWIGMTNAPQADKLACPEQQVLQSMIEKCGLDLYRLPEEYVYVADFKDKPGSLREVNNAARKVDPIIYHHQASRTMRAGKPGLVIAGE